MPFVRLFLDLYLYCADKNKVVGLPGFPAGKEKGSDSSLSPHTL
jgi:hypothetical protein